MTNGKYAHTGNGSSGTPQTSYATDAYVIGHVKRVLEYHRAYGSPKTSTPIVVHHPTNESVRKTQRIPQESFLVVAI
jgi:hypothetical protein